MSLPTLSMMARASHSMVVLEAFDPWKMGGYESLVRHLKASIPPPFAIFCITDMPAVHLAAAAMKFGLRIPEEAALLGTDNSPLICRFSRPRLSSIELNGFAIGQRVGELLTELDQHPVPAPPRNRHDPKAWRLRAGDAPPEDARR